MQSEGTMTHRFWDFIEDGSFEWEDATYEERVYFREVAAGFLRATFVPPAGHVIDVLEAHYVSRFPVVALGWDAEPEPLPLAERQRVIRGIAEALNRFVRAVDWEEVARIRRGMNGSRTDDDRVPKRTATTALFARRSGAPARPAARPLRRVGAGLAAGSVGRDAPRRVL